MALDRRTRERLREFCLEIHDDDGVDPAPDASQFMVTLALNPGVPCEQRADWESLIATHAPRLRCEVAAAITRKKVPKLVFRIVASDPPKETQR